MLVKFHSLFVASFWQTLKNQFNPAAAAGTPLTVGYALDMHSHLLPGVDDGIQEIDEALVCLQQLADWGIRHIVTTPHISQDFYPNTSAHLHEAGQQIQALIATHDLPLTFTVAAEYLTDELFDARLQQNDLLNFGTERFVLIETGWAALPRQLPQWLFQMQVKGYQPILAHPERYLYFRGKSTQLAELRQHGCRLQLNLMSLTGRYGDDARRMARTLIREGLVDFVASDLHRARDLTNLELALRSADYRAVCQLPLTMPTFI
ncbi:tyrosine-protein phosphatase [Fibrella aquatilis]|uniref:protein-tyrosine-phosphatase n=1 Tax=Fibrella aquatilis TaxID=2817059 RepID=A0A939GAA2_9BACT|nr:CpsB/CapC family capsule biosynthesis tyrosine phosphatase [Fibrella aquatilis]MBO0933554.1 histidinol-phosphatase [Fibrella aquatilis]